MTSKATLKTLRREAAKYRALVEGDVSGHWATYNVDAPEGKLWSCSDVHSLCVTWRVGDAAYREEAIEDALERMADGLHDCDDPDCDVCTGGRE